MLTTISDDFVEPAKRVLRFALHNTLTLSPSLTIGAVRTFGNQITSLDESIFTQSYDRRRKRRLLEKMHKYCHSVDSMAISFDDMDLVSSKFFKRTNRQVRRLEIVHPVAGEWNNMYFNWTMDAAKQLITLCVNRLPEVHYTELLSTYFPQLRTFELRRERREYERAAPIPPRELSSFIERHQTISNLVVGLRAQTWDFCSVLKPMKHLRKVSLYSCAGIDLPALHELRTVPVCHLEIDYDCYYNQKLTITELKAINDVNAQTLRLYFRQLYDEYAVFPYLKEFINLDRVCICFPNSDSTMPEQDFINYMEPVREVLRFVDTRPCIEMVKYIRISNDTKPNGCRSSKYRIPKKSPSMISRTVYFPKFIWIRTIIC